VQDLIDKSKWLRREIFEMVISKQKGHIPSCFSLVEILIALYYRGYIKPGEDKVIVSKGHAAMALYPILMDKGLIDKSEKEKFTEKDGMLRMYADPSIPGIESVTGSLGHGLGIGLGYALAAKLDRKPYSTYVILGDGECYEGSIWEALMFASHHKLNNLCVIVDRNNQCIMDETENCVKLEPLNEKFKAFGFNLHVINGHSYKEIEGKLFSFMNRGWKTPTVIIANTIKGKGISFMENKASWHNKMMTPTEVEIARKELY